MSDDIGGFLSRKGAIPLVSLLNVEDGRIVNQLYSQLNVSRQSLSDLLKEAYEKDIVDREYLTSDHGNAKRFVLTQRGIKIAEKIDELDLYESYEELQTIQSEYDMKSDKLRVWASKNPL